MIWDGEAASPENFSYFFSQRKSLLRALALFFFPSLAGRERLWRFVWNALGLYFLSLSWLAVALWPTRFLPFFIAF